MKVSVKALATSRQFEVEMAVGSSVADLKQKIQAVEGSPESQQRLISKGKNLKDAEILSDPSGTGISIHLVLRLASYINVTIRTMSGKSIDIPIKPAGTVGNVMTLLEDLLQMPNASAWSRLNLYGQLLGNELILEKVPVKTGDILRLILLPLPHSALPPLLASQSPETSEAQSRMRVYGDLGSLYARCGGIFGVAGFADRCMDMWMADSTLNSNSAVATWHARAQRCGFKFLVTQLMAYLTGGPHRYTGRPIGEAHKYLNISPREWEVFMGIFNGVCAEFALPSHDVEDLAAIVSSMEQDCVVHPGEDVPPNPGPVKQNESTLYGKLGGVYPLALFADRLIDALLQDRRVNIPVDGQRRNEASLKYLFTELVCNITGGPEIMTSTELAETRLLLTGRTFFYLLEAAKAASDHFTSDADRAELIKKLYAVQHLIIDPRRGIRISTAMQERQAAVAALGQTVGVELLYLPGAGVVKLDFGADRVQLDRVQHGLQELGFKTVEKTQVKTVGAAAAGNVLSSATIAARYAAPGAFVAARKRVHGDPQTLYGRGGGVFGLAKLADQVMDAWMADPVLNANVNVARWHESQQKFGFKFLVTQIFGYLTGGPQRYTGQPMDIAHKHLGISPRQWDSFMSGLDMICRRFNMDAMTHRDIRGIIASFRDQIICQEGEQPPADPGLCRKQPAGTSFYADAGGVYPLAHFVDVLVEKSLQTRNLKISWESGRNPEAKRTAAGLKYLVTELICSGAGGPEIVTSRGFDDAKLGVPEEEWQTFLEIATAAANAVWNSTTLTNGMLCLLEEQKAELCTGLVKADLSAEAAARQRLREAGYSHVETTAALSRCNGEAEEALALLVSGWTPEKLLQQQQQQLQNGATAAPPPTGQMSCPFSGMIASASQGVCPFSGSGSAKAPTSTSGYPSVNGNSSSSSNSAHLAGRLLGNALQDQLDVLLFEDPDLSCPITLILFLNPVIASDGCVYERAALLELLRTQGLSLVTHKPLSKEIFPAVEIQAKIHAFMLERGQQLYDFACQALKENQAGMAIAACQRLKAYLAVLMMTESGRLAAALHQGLEELHLQLGQGKLVLPDPSARIQHLLSHQVEIANSDAIAKTKRENRKGGAGSKTVFFTVDKSGSMSVNRRMEGACENLLKIFDDYVEDDDQLGMITFNHFTDVIFELQHVGSNREALRCKAERACRTSGGTAFYDALIKTVELLGKTTSKEDSPGSQWIISLTDGEDQHSKNSLEQALKAIQESPAKPNLIIVGIQLSACHISSMERLTTATNESIFIDASGGLESLDDAFQQIAELICE